MGNVLVTISDNRVPVDDGTYDVVTICPSCLPGYPCLVCYNEYIPVSGTADGNIDYYTAVVLTANDYYPFGMGMPGRKYSADGAYRYGFNGQEKSGEIDASGNSMTAEFWQYDARLGRRWNMDPVLKAYESPFSVLANNPVWLVDQNGADTIIYNKNGKQIERFFATSNSRHVYLLDTGQDEQSGSFEFHGKRYHRGFSYFSLFGDPEANFLPTAFKQISKEITSLQAFLKEEDRTVTVLSNAIMFPYDKRLSFWRNSGTGGIFDFKTKGVLGKNGESVVYEVEGVLYNSHELGMMKLGYVASAVYSNYSQLFLHNSLFHKSVEGNGDEWNEMYSWTFGYAYGTGNGKTVIETRSAADRLLKTEHRLYWLLPAPYRGDPNFVAEPDKEGVKTNIKRAIILTMDYDEQIQCAIISLVTSVRLLRASRHERNL
ncbi:MAG: hypothetical protein ACK4E0_05880 [Chitinophagaceae bacterium]